MSLIRIGIMSFFTATILLGCASATMRKPDSTAIPALRDLTGPVPNLKDQNSGDIAKELASHSNIHVFPSAGPCATKNETNCGFVLTHTKAMVVDNSLALVTSINLTTNASVQRDYGILTTDQGVISEMNRVFAADITNSTNAQAGKQPQQYTPLVDPTASNLTWSNVNSDSELVNLINRAKDIPKGKHRFVYATVENIDDPTIINALSSAAGAGVDVRLIVPQCVLGSNGNRSYHFLPKLTNGVQYRAAHYPPSPEKPYMHGKMVVLGSGELYVGSVNYTVNSTQRNRELGIIFANSAIAQHLAQDLFLKDWYVADSVTADDIANPPNCPTNTLNPLSEKNNT